MIRVDLEAWALLLIAMAVAYFVCLKASKEGNKIFQYGGYVIGIIILVMSLYLGISDLASRIRRRIPPRRTQTITPRTQRQEVPSLPPEIQERLRQQQGQSQ